MRRLCLSMVLLAAPALAQQDFSELFEHAIEQERNGGSAEQLRPAFAAALRAFLKLPADVPQHSSLLPQAGRAALGAGRAALAGELLEQARSAGEIDAYLVAWWLRAQLAAGFVESSLGRARQWDRQYPGPVGEFLAGADGTGRVALLEGAGRALRRGDHGLALWLFARVAAGQHPIAIANLALAQRHLDRLDESERSYRRALELAPDDAMLWNDYGLLLKGSGRISEAWEAFQRSYRLEPSQGMGPATTNLLLLSRNAGRDWPMAGAALEALLRLRPEAALPRRLAILRILAEN